MDRLLNAYAHRFYYGLLVLSLLLVAFAGWVSVRAAMAAGDAIDSARQSQRVIEQVNEVMAVFGSTESFGLRWAVSFDDAMWERFQAAMRQLDTEAASLTVLVAADDEQRRDAEALAAAVAERHAHGKRAWPMLREGGVEASIALVSAGRGAQLGDRIRAPANAIIERETVRRLAREDHLREQLERAVATVVSAIGLAIVAGLIGVLATHQSRRSWVREREADLQREKAEAANQQKSLFLATMSHEIRTPMNAIFGFSQLLARRVHDPKALEYVRAIRSSGQSLLALINDLLDLSKIEAGRLELHVVPTDLRELVDSTLSVFAEPAAAKGLRLTADVDPFLPKTLVVDPHRLRQVLVNLVSNAVKYTDHGFVRVHVRVAPLEGQRADVEIAVSDSGSGIAEAQQARIFDPFYRAVAEGAGSIEGTGLGLSIVRRLVALMQGSVDVQSALGEGSVFTVRLPSLEVATPEQPLVSLRPVAANFAKLAPTRILIVDDVPLNRELLSAYLADSGHELDFADNGLDAIEKVREWKPGVVLMDIRMPKLDGRQAAERIRELEEGRRICLVAVTASSMSNEERILRRVFDAYLRKPVSPQELYDCLLELVGTRREPEGCSKAVQDAQSEADGDTPPTAEQRERAEPAVQALERMVEQRLGPVQATMRMRELKLFADDIATLGGDGDMRRIAEFAARLTAAVEAFDMTTIDSLLEQMPRHVAAERSRLKED